MPRRSEIFKHADIGARHAGDFETAACIARIGDLDFDFLVVQLTVAQFLAEAVARGGRCGRADKRIENPFFGVQMRLGLDLGALLFLDQHNAGLDQIAHDLLDVAADIADFGELGGFDLDEGRAGQTGETAGNFRLADAGRADHEDVLGHDFIAQVVGQLLPAPAVAQRDRHRALGLMLANDIAIELGDDLAGREIGHLRESNRK